MADAEIARHQVECAVRKWQMLDLRFAEVDAGMAGLRQRDHAGSEVDSGRLRALLVRSRRQRTGTAGRRLKQLVARLEAHGLQQRRDRIRRDRGEEMIVALGERVVARALKGAERGIDSDSSGVIRPSCPFVPLRMARPRPD